VVETQDVLFNWFAHTGVTSVPEVGFCIINVVVVTRELPFHISTSGELKGRF
jgi:hypothetical protein